MATSHSPKASNYVLFDKLPKEVWWRGTYDLYQWEGFWYILPHLEAAIATRSLFKPCDDDVILASLMKTGTTWLKALIPSIMNCCDDESTDPLLKNHPNVLIPSLEIQVFRQNSDIDLTTILSPRLFRTHVPYAMLSESVKTSACKVVYITRDPKDAFVLLLHFTNTRRTPEQGPIPMDEAFEIYCNGVHPFRPFHEHVLEYWKESLKKPEKILFLKYEEMKRDPRGEVKKLASFLGRSFVKEEEVDKILWRCSLERLKDLEVNKNGVDLGLEFLIDLTSGLAWLEIGRTVYRWR